MSGGNGCRWATRVQKEMRAIVSDTSLAGQVSVRPLDSSLSELIATITGPPETPFAGGSFELLIKIPPSYPFEPPCVRFLTRIWHPNVSSATGYICLDVLGHAWSASQTLVTLLLSIQSLMQDPAPDDPQDAVVARQMTRTPGKYRATARFWTREYASLAPASTPLEPEMQLLEAKVLHAMSTRGKGRVDAVTHCSVRNWCVPLPPAAAAAAGVAGTRRSKRLAARRAAAAGASSDTRSLAASHSPQDVVMPSAAEESE